MKRILFSCMVAFMASNSNAQVLFTQNFSSSPNIADYVRVHNGTPNALTIGDNMFSYAKKNNDASTVASVSIVDGKLRFHRTGEAGSPNNVFGMAASRTAQNSNGSTGTLAASSAIPQVLKVSCDISVSDFSNAMTNVAMFQVGGNNLHGQGFSSVAATDGPCHSGFGITVTGEGRYRFSRPTADGNEGNADDLENVNYSANYPAGSTQHITWYINNSGSNIPSYTGPDGESYSLTNNTWDLFVGNTRILAGRTAVNGAQNLNNFVISARAIALGGLTNPGGNAFTLDIDNLVITNITNSLPVSLTTFTGITAAAGNLLKWQTASEQQNSHFDIMRSTDGKEFAKIGREEGKGTTTEVTNYQFTDYNPAPGVNYYKLRQVDFNGNSEESRVVSINPFHQKENLSINAADNNLEVRYQSEKAGPAQFAIHDINGRLLLKQGTSVTAGENVFSCPVILIPGIYVGSVNAGGTVIQTKFQK